MLLCAVLARPAQASDLVAGAVRDTDGYPVAGAAVTLADSSGATLARTQTGADGTFAADVGAPAAHATVACAYCRRTVVDVGPIGTLVIVVRRSAALRDSGISADDALVLPYARVTRMAALLPFAVGSAYGISDRGLARGAGALALDGQPTYRALDGADPAAYLPAHAAAAIAASGPAASIPYDERAAGGLFSVDTLETGLTARVDGGRGYNGLVRGGTAVRAAFAASDVTGTEQRGILDASLPVSGGNVNVRASSAGSATVSASALSATYAGAFAPQTPFSLSYGVVHSLAEGASENDAIGSFVVRRGAMTYGARARRSSGALPDGTGTQTDTRAYVEAAPLAGPLQLHVALALANAGDGVPARSVRDTALLPEIALDANAGRGWSARAGSVDALLPATLTALDVAGADATLDRSHLLEAAIGYDDLRAVRIEAIAFRERITGPSPATLGGTGISAIWQIAPSLALRAWTLVSRSATATDNAYGPYRTTYGTTVYDRDILWLTAGNALRVDAIARGGAIDGDVSVPLGRLRVIAGTRRDPAGRTTTLGIVLR